MSNALRDLAGNPLGLDDDDSARPGKDMVDVAGMEDDVVHQEVVVGQARQQLRDRPLSQPSLPRCPYAPGDLAGGPGRNEEFR